MSRAAGFTQLVMLVALFVLSNVGYTQSRESPSVQITPTQPFIINTFEVPEVRVVPVATGLANPFDMAFRDNGDILITERYSGKVRVVRDGNLLQSDITGVPEIYSEIFRAGLMAIALHPDDDRMVYLTYHKPLMVDGEPEQTVTLARARLVENTLTQVEEIFVAEGLDRAIAASQLLFTTDNKLMMSIGGAYVFAATGDLAQDPGSHYG